MRLGVFSPQVKDRLSSKTNIWIHAVSVGEVMMISHLIAKIKSAYPNYNIVLTVTTKTGYELACLKLGSEVVVIPSPLDFTWVVSAFVRLIKPRIYIAAETEIWPNLFNCLHKQNIPIAIVNGRISDASFGRYKVIKFLLEKVLKKVSLFCMQGDMDVHRIVELGAVKEKVLSVGNIKFDDLSLDRENDFKLPIPPNCFLWIAGSTHPGEEEIVLKVYDRHKDSF